MNTLTLQTYLQIDDITSGSPTLVSRYQNFNLEAPVTYLSNSYTYAPFEVSDLPQQRSSDKLSVNITFPGTAAFIDLLTASVVTYRYKYTIVFTAAEILPAVFATVIGVADSGSSNFTGVTINISDGVDPLEAQIPTRKVTYDMVPFLL